MGQQVIGLDVGTHAVRAVELAHGRGRRVVRRMGQVALPEGAVVAGEVVDAVQVSTALRRLWNEAGFRSRSVVVGVANARVVARMTELPDLPERELRSSLPYQVQDLIPIPVADAELDFQVVDRVTTDDGTSRLQVLLVGAHRDMLRNLLDALAGANLTATRIDLIPFALIRALHDPSSWLDPGKPLGGLEVIIGSGAGVTNVVVHENGMPRFVRTLPTGGATVTDALARDLGIDNDDAEAVKRGVGALDYAADQPHVDEVALASLEPLANEVSGSLDFHLAQTGHSELRRVVLSGGGARLGTLRAILEDQLGVPVVDGDPFLGLDTSKVPLAPEVVAASADYFTVALGLALSGAMELDGVRRISLIPASVSERQAERRQVAMAGVGVGAFAAILVGAAFARGMQVDDRRAEAERGEDRVSSLETQVAAFADIERMETDIATGRETVVATLDGDIAWTGLLQDITAVMPEDVWLTSFRGSRGEIGTPGSVEVTAKGVDQTSAARWLLRAGELRAMDGLWLASSEVGEGGRLVDFTSSADLVPPAESPRLARYTEVRP